MLVPIPLRLSRVTWMADCDFGTCELANERRMFLVRVCSMQRRQISRLEDSTCSSLPLLRIAAIHEGGITSVQFDPTNATQVLTNSMDSSLKIVDIRTCTAVQTLRHPEFQTSHTWSKSVFSPDGRYVAAGSSSNGTIFVWDVSDGKIKKRLPGHTSGVCGIDWSRGGSSGQQVASIDRKGSLILWA